MLNIGARINNIDPLITATINLTPALTGVIGEMWIDFSGQWYYVMPTPASIAGVITVGYDDSSPTIPHKIILPEQTIGGITYLQIETPTFDLLSDPVFNLQLTPKEEPPPNGEPTPGDWKETAKKVLMLASPMVVGLFLVRKE